MKVLFITPYPIEGASSRYRIYQYLHLLEINDIKTKVRPFISSKLQNVIYKKNKLLISFYLLLSSINRIIDVFRCFNYDIVFIHREAFPFGPNIIERIFKLIGKKIILDFDDAIFLPYAKKSRFALRITPKDRTISLIKLADHIIVGNNYLCDFVKPINNNVSLLPTPIDTDKFTLKISRENITTIGWVGSFSTSEYINEVEQAIKYLSSKYNIKFRIVGSGRNISIPGVNVENIEWSLKNEVIDFQKINIGIYPLPNDLWARGKCGFKAIQYMSCGVPVVASPIGVNKEIIKDGFNGFLAETQEDWIKKIELLINDKELRTRIGKEGRRTVEEKYSVSANFPKLLQILKSLSKA